MSANPPSADVLLRVQHVSKRFGGLVATDDVSFVVGRGEIVGLIGPNGAGKTTLFNCIAGYFAPSAGEIHLAGVSIAGKSPEACARLGVARTFQIARTFSSMTALENVMVGAFLKTRDVATARAKSLALLQFVDLAGHAERPSGTMTISEQRRLAVARALATEPSILLMDEVMAGLNPSEVKEAVAVVLRIRAQGISCLIVEHVLEGIMPIANRIVVLDGGKKIADDRPEVVSNDAAVLAAYLGA
jgi:branched-chain amino acid transport system ATP-binding protein